MRSTDPNILRECVAATDAILRATDVCIGLPRLLPLCVCTAVIALHVCALSGQVTAALVVVLCGENDRPALSLVCKRIASRG